MRRSCSCCEARTRTAARRMPARPRCRRLPARRGGSQSHALSSTQPWAPPIDVAVIVAQTTRPAEAVRKIETAEVGESIAMSGTASPLVIQVTQLVLRFLQDLQSALRQILAGSVDVK